MADGTHSRPLAQLSSGTKGAVLAEFAIAIVPMLAAFFSFTQLAYAYTAGLVMRHAAVVAARYAAVTKAPCLPNKPAHDLNAAAKAALGPWSKRIEIKEARVDYNGGDPYGAAPTTVKFTYRCEVPLGKNIVCQSGLLSKEIKVTFPHQGAKYAGACK